MSQKDLDKRKELFCCYYVILGNPEEAAVKAGFPKTTAALSAAECLKNQDCRKTISELKTIFADHASVRAGLKRLAFGSCKDAVSLVFTEELPPQSVIDKLDLFNVSEIKRDKNGGVEIKLFDRIKALEKLNELEMSLDSQNTAAGLLAALTASAKGDENDDNQTL